MRYLKKGQIEAYQIVITIIAVLGLVIALFFWYAFKDVTDVSDDACRLSVLTKTTAADKLHVSTPLKCTTKKICITTENAKECTQFLGEENIQTIILTGDDYQKARQIEQAAAENMYNCWSMMGEGKLNLFNGASDASGFLSNIFAANSIKPVCVICSRVSLGRDITDTVKGQTILKGVNFPNYLSHNTIPGGDITYIEYFTDRRFRAYPADFNAQINDFANGETAKPTNQIAFIFMQILTEKEPLEQAEKSGLTTGIVAGTALFSGVTGKITSFISAPWKIGITLFGAAGSFGITFIQQSNNQKIAATYCGQYTAGEVNPSSGKPLEKYGCSIIQPIDYNNITAINKLCSSIEGNP